MAPEDSIIIEMHPSLESCALEMSYEKEGRQLEEVCHDERLRRLRVQNLLLEGERDDLQLQLEQDDERIDYLETSVRELGDEQVATAVKFKSAQGDIWTKSREIETLKADLSSLQGASMESTKLLTEKLTLTRELSLLRPEVDHLRSQAASHQSLLAEKLSLQRQLSSLQVELETEKRSFKRSAIRDRKNKEEDVRLNSTIEELRADLTKERRDTEKAEREVHKISTEWKSEVTILESKVDTLKSKLKTIREQLKESRTHASVTSDRPFNPTASSSHGLNPRKRAVLRMDDDNMIGTPGDMPAAKKNKQGQAAIGEKSTFSITPFLSRIASMAPQGPISGSPILRNTTTTKSPVPSRCGAAYSKELSVGTVEGGDFKHRNDDITHSTKPAFSALISPSLDSKTSAAKDAKVILRPGQAQEVDSDGDVVGRSYTMAEEEISNPAMARAVQVKKTKRKFLGSGLGKTLFDIDDHDDNDVAPSRNRRNLSRLKSLA
ncbi:MAG: hypothetical protein Q9163_004616 [Psora crenata]